MTLLMVALGGAVGTAMRYGLAELGQRWAPEAWFPWGTFAANVLGSFLLGWIFIAAEDRTIADVDMRLVLGTGVMGGFTTYSSYNLELIRMLSDGETLRSGMYLGATLVACLVAGFAGLALGRLLR